MNHILQCGDLTAAISDVGGQLCSLNFQGHELIWQGSALWNDHAPLLFPICGRVKNNAYHWKGVTYPMTIHGFLAASQMKVSDYNESSLTLQLSDSPESRAVYPFGFELIVCWRLTGQALACETAVRAKETPLPFSFGAHPGFALPCTAEGFGDAVLTFDRAGNFGRVELTEDGFFTGRFTEYPLKEGRILPLTPDPALGCGLFLQPEAGNRAVTLSAATLPVKVRVDFPDFPYLGLWHAEGGDFLCIEPWQGLPALDTPETEFENKPGSITLAAGEKKILRFSIGLN